jgi:D-glycero-D-manno-heptose 1,7-bisphosphate phosphatase
MRMVAKKALFLDRDGVINRDDGYVHSIADFHFLPGIMAFCRAAREHGYSIFIITNQAGIGRGYYTEAIFWELMQWVQQQFQAEGVQIQQVYFCPHHPDAGIGDYKRACTCRKPNPGMLLQAEKDWQINLAASLMIGDSQTDLAAAEAAGVPAVLFTGDFSPLYPLLSK